MDGYILSFALDSAEDGKLVYWSGSSFTEDISKSQFFSNVMEVRELAGSLQSQYVDRTVTILPAKNGVHLTTLLS